MLLNMVIMTEFILLHPSKDKKEEEVKQILFYQALTANYNVRLKTFHCSLALTRDAQIWRQKKKVRS